MAVTLLGDSPATLNGRIAEHTEREIRVVIERALPPGAAVKVEWEQVLLLAEVRACGRRGDEYLAVLEIAHALYDTKELARLALTLMYPGR
ncbi:MAG: hypothetical protein HYR60_27630 [Acidobacteria bacterium]|nr:hypothetical protein [Acidobacteriota bacterium]